MCSLFRCTVVCGFMGNVIFFSLSLFGGDKDSWYSKLYRWMALVTKAIAKSYVGKMIYRGSGFVM